MFVSKTLSYKIFILCVLLMPLPAQASLVSSDGEQVFQKEKVKNLIAQDGFGGEAPIKQYIDPDDRDTDAAWGPKPVPHDILMDDDNPNSNPRSDKQKNKKREKSNLKSQ